MADSDNSAALFSGLDSLDTFDLDQDSLDLAGAAPAPVDGLSPEPSNSTTSAAAAAGGSISSNDATAPVGAGLSPSVPVSNTFASSDSAATNSPAFFNRGIPNWGFQDTPPYDSYSSENPFETIPPLPPQTWDVPVHLMNGNTQGGQPQQSPIYLENTAAANLPPDLYAAAVTAMSSGYPHVQAGETKQPARPDISPDVLLNLTPAQQEKLRTIAMPPHLQYHSPKSPESPDSNSSGNENIKGGASSPELAELSKTNRRKRKSSAEMDDDDDDDELDGQQPIKKTAHNMIEKRYRTNLNDKIAALRDSVPALRIMSKSARGEDTTEDREELHGLTPAHKLNKATVLSKATEYIRHLEKRNNRLIDENNSMQARIAAFEKLFMAGAIGGMSNPLQQPPTPIQYPQDTPAFLNTPIGTPRGPDPPGMIPVPDDMKRLLSSQQMAAGRPYPVPSQPYQHNPALLRQQQIQQQQQAQAQRWNPYLGKLMVGSLAGLMLVGLAMTESERSMDKPEGRGLFAIGCDLVVGLFPRHVGFAGRFMPVDVLIRYVEFVMAILLFLNHCGAFPQWSFGSEKQKVPTSNLQAVPSLASPIHVRRQAWLTAIQTVWVPHHNFFLEAVALAFKTFKYALRNVIGVSGYQLLAGLTEEQEAARVKAWTIALDAQLAGGDIEINRSRLTLTLIASGTLPTTPMRLMMKALHIRVLLWQAPLPSELVNMFAAKLARSLWNQARELNCILNQLREGNPSADEELPEHLALLLSQECDKVFTHRIVQRAHNLAWNQPTTHRAVDFIDGMDTVVDDPAVRSPMDAIAAWYSCAILQGVLDESLSQNMSNEEYEAPAESKNSMGDNLALAIKLAPIGSNAQTRALVARAILVNEKRGVNIAAAIKAMGPVLNPDKHPQYSKGVPPLIDSPLMSTAQDADVQMALRCAMAIAHLQKYSIPPPEAIAVIRSILPRPGVERLALLAYSGAFHLMEALHRHETAKDICSDALERLAGTLRIWIGSAEGNRTGLDPSLRLKMVDRCLTVTKSAAGIESDPGYGSMSDCDVEDGEEC